MGSTPGFRSPDSLVAHVPVGLCGPAGDVCRDVELAAPNGLSEEYLAAAEPGIALTRFVSALLERAIVRIGALAPVTRERVEELAITDRDTLVLRLAELMTGPVLWITLDCPAAGCSLPMELRLELVAMQVEPKPEHPWEAETALGRIPFDVPRGGDLECLLNEGQEGTSTGRVIARCVQRAGWREDLKDDELEAVEAAIERVSADTEFEADAVCPHCGHAFTAMLDLIPRLVSRIRQACGHIQRDVHLLASHYHWREADILALPRSRRLRYLALIDADVWGN